jgi:hypothetical protein
MTSDTSQPLRGPAADIGSLGAEKGNTWKST